jgi:hypothetical protein
MPTPRPRLDTYVAAVAVVFTLAWPPELWAGTILYGALAGLALSVLVLPPAGPSGVRVREA